MAAIPRFMVCAGKTGTPDDSEEAEYLRKLSGRPLLCTEYMARPIGSTFDPLLGYFKEEKIGCHCWGFVAGKSNTIFAWKTWQEPEPNPEPKVWFHDIFRTDGTPFDAKEVEYIQKTTGAKK